MEQNLNKNRSKHNFRLASANIGSANTWNEQRKTKSWSKQFKVKANWNCQSLEIGNFQNKIGKALLHPVFHWFSHT